MQPWTGYLDTEELRELTNTIVGEGLALPGSLDALLNVALPPSFRALLLGDGLVPKLRVSTVLSQMNKVHNLLTGEVPLASFLAALTDATANPAALAVFNRALSKVKRHEPTAAAPADAGLAANRVLDLAGANTAIEQEVQIGDFDETLAVDFMRRGLATAESVFKIVVHRHINGNPDDLPDGRLRLSNATGWVIAPGLGITNYHVFNCRAKLFNEPDASDDDYRKQTETARVFFDYFAERDWSQGIELGDGALLARDQVLDYALFRLPNQFAGRKPIQLRRLIVAKTTAQALGMRVNVLQHPEGKPMRVGFRRNFVVKGDNDALAYLTDTSAGSSGSPVCDDTWSVAALHYGARPISDQNLQLMGKLMRQENVGTPIPTILGHLAANHAALHQKIADGQAGLGS
jgi:V8-like Glu-specific endopeptidase